LTIGAGLELTFERFSLTILSSAVYKPAEDMERSRTRLIHEFILDHVSEDGAGVAGRIAKAYGISRQAANRHLDGLIGAGLLRESGSTRAKRYELRPTGAVTREFRITPVLNADRVWDDHAAPMLAGEREPVRNLCRAAFNELVRNASTHAGGSWLTLSVSATARHIDLAVSDDGLGIFVALAGQWGVRAPREAAEELARRARTRANDHPAARLVLLARNFEWFALRSSAVELLHGAESNEWEVHDAPAAEGTTIMLRCRREPRDSARTPVPPHPRSTPRRPHARPREKTVRS
jgi:predicted transcriptional regulator